MPPRLSYDCIEAAERGCYLDWLASGRSDKRCAPGYIFLYFYGLEYRFFMDDPDDSERRLLVAEVRRLLGIYGADRHVRLYLSKFLDVTQVLLGIVDDMGPSFEKFPPGGLPLSLKVKIGCMIREGQPLSADWLLAWYMTFPGTNLHMPARREFDEFRALFGLLFSDRYPQGLKAQAPERMLSAGYRAASAAFRVDLSSFLGTMPDIREGYETLGIAREIAAQATQALANYSRFLGRNPQQRGSIAARALLPKRLRPLFPCVAIGELREWAESFVASGDMPSLSQVIRRIGPCSEYGVPRRDIDFAARTLGRLGIGMTPVSWFGRQETWGSRPVVLFRLPHGSAAVEEGSDRYESALLKVVASSLVAHADGSVSSQERRTIRGQVDEADLSDAERICLHANRRWLLHHVPSRFVLWSRLRAARDIAPQDVRLAVLTVAFADGAIDPDEVKEIEAIYRAIGLEPSRVPIDLYAFQAPTERGSPQSDGADGPGSESPPSQSGQTVDLDPARIAVVVRETARASSVLGEVFAGDAPAEDTSNSAEGGEQAFSGLDAPHTAMLLELLKRNAWDDAELAALAKRFRLMPAGALEALNEWCFERFDDLLVEEGDGYELNPDVVEELEEAGCP